MGNVSNGGLIPVMAAVDLESLTKHFGGAVALDGDIGVRSHQEMAQGRAGYRERHIEEALPVREPPSAEEDEAGVYQNPRVAPYDCLRLAHCTPIRVLTSI